MTLPPPPVTPYRGDLSMGKTDTSVLNRRPTLLEYMTAHNKRVKQQNNRRSSVKCVGLVGVRGKK